MRETKREQTLRKKFLSTLQKARYCHATLACRAHPAWEATEACLEASDVVGRKAGTMALLGRDVIRLLFQEKSKKIKRGHEKEKKSKKNKK